MKSLKPSLLTFLAGLIVWAATHNTFAATHNVSIIDFSFQPAELTIEAGDTVVWTQVDSAGHTTTSDNTNDPICGGWNSPLLSPGQTFSHTFQNPGTCTYHCTPHPFMQGTIIINAGANKPPTVSITNPAQSAQIGPEGFTVIQADAADPDGQILNVRFRDATRDLGTDSTSPYSLAVNLSPGSHSLTAIATDNEGEQTVSVAVNVNVDAPAAPSIGGITQNESSVSISAGDGAGPFLLQRKDQLTDSFWITDQVFGGGAAQSDLADARRFMRIANLAGTDGVVFTAHLSGDAEQPDPVTTDATGTAMLRLDGNVLKFNIRYRGLSGDATAAHIHGPAPASENAGVMLNLQPFHIGAFGTSGDFSGTLVLNESQKLAMLAGDTYINVHTAANGSGEIRGQIAPVVMQTRLKGIYQREEPVDSPAAGFGTLLLIGDELTFHINYSGFSETPTAAHIHGAAGVNESAGVLINLAPYLDDAGGFGTSGRFIGSVQLTPVQLQNVIDGRTYVNIHTPTHSGGEIRGQILPNVAGKALSVSFSGDAQRPDPVDTPASGSALLQLEGSTLHFNIRYRDLTGTASAAHFHGPATAEESTGVAINLGPFVVGGFGETGDIAGSVALTETQRQQLLDGLLYINIHTPTHGSGEIRGQVAPVAMRSLLNGDNERPDPVFTSGNGTGLMLLKHDTLHLHVVYRDLTGTASASHIHGPAGVDESTGVLIGLDGLNGGAYGVFGRLAGSVLLNPDQLGHVVDERTYINIHTPMHGPGEIRGQILR